MRDVSALITAITLEAQVSASAILALQATQQHLDDAQAQIAALRQQFAAGAIDPDQLTKLLDTVSTTTAQLSAAIPANTTPSAATDATTTIPASTTVDAAVQARDAAPTTAPAPGTATPAAPGAFAQPTDAATAGLAAGPGPATVTTQP